ncbi:MAG: hypothetical protein C9356_13130 [Oleiphilus sp.]|nr:MAG: hypothetical protein C9356_13130 [Oleiphilus sp.]
MSITLISSIIIFIILAALIVSSISYNRQKAIAQQRKEIARHKKQAAEILPLRDFIATVDPEYELLMVLQKQLVLAMENVLEIVPMDAQTRALASSENQRLKQFKEGKRQTEIDQVMTTEEDLKISKQTLARISKHLDISRNAGHLSASVHQRLHRHTLALSLLIEVASHEHQAAQCADKGDIVLYQTHLKQAREALKKAPIDEEEKNTRIRVLTETLNEIKRTNRIVALPEYEAREEVPLSQENESPEQPPAQ